MPARRESWERFAIANILESMVPALLARRYFEIPQRQFQAAVFGMIVVADGECDVDRIACQKRCLMHSFRHVPAQGVEGNFSSQFSVVSSQLNGARVAFVDRCGSFPAPDDGTVGMAACSRQNCGCGEFLDFTRCRIVSDCARPELQLDVLVFQNSRRGG